MSKKDNPFFSIVAYGKGLDDFEIVGSGKVSKLKCGSFKKRDVKGHVRLLRSIPMEAFYGWVVLSNRFRVARGLRSPGSDRACEFALLKGVPVFVFGVGGFVGSMGAQMSLFV